MFVADAKSVWCAWNSARAIQLMHDSPNIDNCLAYVAANVNGVFSSRSWDQTDRMPRGLFVYTNDNLAIVLLDGSPTAVFADRLLGGYLEQPQVRTYLGVNRTLYAALSDLLAGPLRNTFAPGMRCLFAGHSAGGALAILLYQWVLANYGPITPKAITLGSPRVGDGRFDNAVIEDDIMRWMNIGDPIPILPPQGNEVPASWIILNAALWQNIQSFQHNGNRRTLYQSDWRDVPTETLAILPNSLSASFLGWASGLLSSPVFEHNISRYESRLSTAAQRTVEPGQPYQPNNLIPAHTTSPAAPGPADVPVQNFTQVADPAVPLPIVDPPTAELPGDYGYYLPTTGLPGKGPFFALKQDGEWFVCYERNALYSSPSHRGAKRDAVHLNEINRHWLDSRFHSPPELTKAVQSVFRM